MTDLGMKGLVADLNAGSIYKVDDINVKKQMLFDRLVRKGLVCELENGIFMKLIDKNEPITFITELSKVQIGKCHKSDCGSLNVLTFRAFGYYNLYYSICLDCGFRRPFGRFYEFKREEWIKSTSNK